MLSQQIGAFEAKTHFSRILKEAEKGAVYIITKRGKPIALLTPYKQDKQSSIKDVVKAIKEIQKLNNNESKDINIHISITNKKIKEN